jgi:hypothetical protein
MRDDSLKRRTFLQPAGAAGLAGSLMVPASLAGNVITVTKIEVC